jgi:protein tyrosine/serine phosphatase
MINPRNIFAKVSAAVALALTLGAAAVLSKPHNNDPAFSEVKISNFGQMDERFFRGARPKQRDFAVLKALGIKTIIDLTDNTPEERGFAEAVGLHYVNIAIRDKRDPSDAQIAEFLKVVNNPETGKFYVHCAGGRHRTGVMGAIYRFNNYNWNFDQVYAEMKDFDFYTSNGHGGQKTFVENYARRFQSESTTRTVEGQGKN